MRKKSLWNRNFTIMFVGTILSALGGIGLNVAFGVVVYDYTQSTFLSSLFVAITTIPSLVLPMFVGSIVDRKDPLKLLLFNETIVLIAYVVFLILLYILEFNYSVFLVMATLISSLGVISELSSQSITAQLMDKDLMSKGYAIISTIYPMCSVLVTPIALYLYKTYGLESVLIIYIILASLDLFLESKIDFDFKFNNKQAESFKDVLEDTKEGIEYLNKHKPIKAVFIFFTIVMVANGYSTLIYPYFNQSAHLTLENYALMMSINSLGYMFGGFFHYFVEIPKKYRYSAALCIYALFIILDSTFLFMPFTLMLISKFILGLAGMNSANIRNTAVQASVEDSYRGKVNGIFSMLMGFAGIIGNLIFGYLGEVISIPTAVIIAQSVYLVVTVFLVLPKKYKVKELFNLELAIKE